MQESVEYDDGITIKVWKSQSDPFDDVLYLMNQTKSNKVTEQWLENKLAWGRGGIATIAYDGDFPIGLVLFGSAPYVESNRTATVLLALYNYVASNYRGRGIYSRLLAVLDKACEAASFDLALIYPNHMARPGVRNSGWSPLASMQAYVHIPLTWRPNVNIARLRKLAKSRSEEFIPIKAEGLDPEDFNLMASRSKETERLHFAQTPAALAYRFNALRGSGYQAIHGEDASAIVRLGWRGSIFEVQFMVTSPNQLVPKEWRELLRVAKKSFHPDMLSKLESNSNAKSVTALSSGFVKLSPVTIPFWKSFQKRSSLNEPILAGIDIHTW